MKQKVVIKVSMNSPKSRTKALKIAVSVSGVESIALGGKDKSQIEVVGEVDSVELTNLLRKNVGHAELVSVSAAGEKKGEKKEEKKEEKKDEAKAQQLAWPCVGGAPYQCIYELKQPVGLYQEPCYCSIM
ncbi:disease resistance protein Pik-1 [Manihot esculenta]|uniref:HMA domain-containing protein n=1 Tax=Manihot esculenta TaxID=3983 RepID=A0A2C9UUB6_MANES|nr:disease resistance protein Pik-1 [Manihot esculenta]OAY35044.1 hypothetical protein MANES_12G067600v8 [Manihot esculenta]